MKLVGDYEHFSEIEKKQTNAALTCYSPNLKYKEEAKPKLNKSITESEHHSTLGHHYLNLLLRTTKLHTLFLYSQPYYVADERSYRYVKSSSKSFFDLGDSNLEKHNKVSLEFYDKVYSELLDILHDPVKERFRSKSESYLDKMSYELARMVLPLSAKSNSWHTINAEVILQHVKTNPNEIPCHKDFIDQVFEKVLDHSPSIKPYFESVRSTSEEDFFFGEEEIPERNIFNTNLFDKSKNIKNLLDKVSHISSIGSLSKLGRLLNQRSVSGRIKMSISCLVQTIRHRPIKNTYYFMNDEFYTDEFLQQSSAYSQWLDYIRDVIQDNKNNPFKFYFKPMGNMVTFDYEFPIYPLINFAKKRLCFNAQREIYLFVEDLVEGLHKSWDSSSALEKEDIDKLFSPPCVHNFKNKVKPTCPEGPRYCRIPVWLEKDRKSARKI